MIHCNERMNLRNVLRLTSSIFFLIIVVACTARTDEQLSTKIVVVNTPTAVANQTWLIFSKEHAEQMRLDTWVLGDSFAGFWTPSAEEVLKLEGSLADYLQQSPSEKFERQPPVWERLDRYHRQYIGLNQNGKQFIYGNYFCSNDVIDWQQELVVVEDGGECYFQLKYDVQSGTFIELRVNGDS